MLSCIYHNIGNQQRDRCVATRGSFEMLHSVVYIETKHGGIYTAFLSCSYLWEFHMHVIHWCVCVCVCVCMCVCACACVHVCMRLQWPVTHCIQQQQSPRGHTKPYCWRYIHRTPRCYFWNNCCRQGYSKRVQRWAVRYPCECHRGQAIHITHTHRMGVDLYSNYSITLEGPQSSKIHAILYKHTLAAN